MDSYLQKLLKAAAILLLVDIFWLSTGGIYARKMTEIIQGQPMSVRYLSAGLVYIPL
jgi:hypothetical protein